MWGRDRCGNLYIEPSAEQVVFNTFRKQSPCSVVRSRGLIHRWLAWRRRRFVNQECQHHRNNKAEQQKFNGSPCSIRPFRLGIWIHWQLLPSDAWLHWCVTFIEEDDSRMVIYGKSVNRPFAHNLMARSDFRKLLHDGKFTQVTFLDSMTFPDFSQVYQVPVDSEVKTSTTPAPVVKSGRDDAAFVIQNCGKPDHEFTEKASGATIRHLVYRRFNTELFFFRAADRPQWGLGNAFVPNQDEDMTMEEANRRMPCAKGQLHSFLESK
jgi:hypothetical protein